MIRENHRVDNTAVVRRLRARMSGSSMGMLGHLPSVMGDFSSELGNRILTTRGVEEMGPTTAPTIPAPTPADDITLLQQIVALLSRMPAALSMEFRTRFIVQPRETRSFINPNGPVAVAAGAAVAIVTEAVPQAFGGFLTHVGVAAPAGALANIVWQLRLNGAIDPNFGVNGNATFAASNLWTPITYARELVQNSQISLVAINNGGAPVDVSGVLVGWTEFLSTNKSYGTTPSGPG